jgi:hypothetical protein
MIHSIVPQSLQLPSTLSMPDFASSDSGLGNDVDELLGYAGDALNPLASQLTVAISSQSFVLGMTVTSTSSPFGIMQQGPSILATALQLESPWLALRSRLLERISEIETIDDQPRYERDRQHIDQDRIAGLRRVRAHESADLYHWYEQKDE